MASNYYQGDPLDQDPDFRDYLRRDWTQPTDSKENLDLRALYNSFDEYWASEDEYSKNVLYQRMKRDYESRLNAAAAGVRFGGRKVYERAWNPTKGAFEYIEKPISPPSPLELDTQIAALNAQISKFKLEGKSTEMLEKQLDALAPGSLEIQKVQQEMAMEELKRERLKGKLAPVKEFLIEPAKEIVKDVVLGGIRGSVKAMSTNKQAMAQAKEAFVPAQMTGPALRPAPQSRFTTPMITELPSRMPVTRGRGGGMIAAGQAIVKPSSIGREVITTVRGSPAAQAILPGNPMRIGTSNLRTEMNLGGLKDLQNRRLNINVLGNTQSTLAQSKPQQPRRLKLNLKNKAETKVRNSLGNIARYIR